MILIKKALLVLGLLVAPFCGIALADDCFNTVIDRDTGEIHYIDPFDISRTYRHKENLFYDYWNRIQCLWETRVFSEDEYDYMVNSIQKNKKDSSSSESLIELIMSILYFIALRKIFVKAWRAGYHSLIPLYNFYEMSDIAWLAWLFKKAFWCLLIWLWMIFTSLFVFPITWFPQIWLVLILIFWIFMYVVNYNIARNFWWSVVSSILYVIFNPIAILILWFWKDEYYATTQKKNMQDEIRKKQLENLVAQWIQDQENVVHNTWDNNNDNNTQDNEVKIDYIDPSKFTS